jgi:hypothetical protein
VLRAAWDRVEVTTDPLPGAIDRLTSDGRALGYLPSTGDAHAAVDLRFLEELDK